MPTCSCKKKVLGWISKAGDATLCRKPRLDEDNQSILMPSNTNIERPLSRSHSRSHATNIASRKHKPLIKHETGERELWRNKVGGDFPPTGRKKHKSLPIPPRKSATSSNPEEGCSNNQKGLAAAAAAAASTDTRRFCVVDPFNLGGHRKSYTLDTPWNIAALFDNIVKDEESPATILIAKKENLTRNSRLSIQPILRNNSKKRNNIAKDIREVRGGDVEVRIFRWESRRVDREKTCSQLYELYEQQLYEKNLDEYEKRFSNYLKNLDIDIDKNNKNSKNNNKNNINNINKNNNNNNNNINNNNNNNNNNSIHQDFRDKPLPPIPPNDDNVHFDDSETMIDTSDLQSIIDTISLISSNYNNNYISNRSSIHTNYLSSSRESFSDLLITEEHTMSDIDDNISVAPSTRDSINSVETLPVEIEICLLCKRKSTDNDLNIQWCKKCEMKRFEQQFEFWSSGNDDIDCFILESQLNSSNFYDYLEWISFDRLQDIELIDTKKGYTFQAIWLDGPRNGCGECLVVLKSFEVPKDSSDFFNQLSKQLKCENNGQHIVRCYGITQNPTKSEEYMLVFQYAKDGNISNYLKQNFFNITWQKRIEILYSLAKDLCIIHEKSLVHGNLHGGNVFLDDHLTILSELEMTRLFNNNNNNNNNNNGIYGVLPFIAPELLENRSYTMASDIYSFGMIMWELIVGKEPFFDREHDEELAQEICKQESRPEIPTDIPECYTNLLEQCWNSDPFKRPCANTLCETISEWVESTNELTALSELSMQFQQSEEKRTKRTESNHDDDVNVNQEVVNTSRFFNFENLYEPNVILTKSLDPKEHLAIREYIANETKFYNLKINSLEVERSDIAAEIYDILQYW